MEKTINISDGTTMTEFRCIPWAEGYRAGDDGRIQSSKRGDGIWRDLKPRISEKGYHRFLLRVGGRDHECQRARLVLEAFVGPCPPGKQACHHPDPDPANCRLDNLRWDTPRENNRDIDRQGRRLEGEKHHHAKLSAADARNVLIRAEAGETIAALAAHYGVDRRTISKVVNGESWKHLTHRKRGWNRKRTPAWLAASNDPAGEG